MSPTLDGDIAQHTIILTLGYTAHELCRAEQDSFRHQCVLLPHWTGPDRMYHFGDDWYTGGALLCAVLLKVRCSSWIRRACSWKCATCAYCVPAVARRLC